MTCHTSEQLPALGICLEEYEYPYPVRFLPVPMTSSRAALHQTHAHGTN
jgi:hypothetical protein